MIDALPSPVASVFNEFFAQPSVAARISQSIVILSLALIVIFIFNWIIDLITPKVAEKADVLTTTENVLRLRRAETIVGLFITVVRVAVIITALFTIWSLFNPRGGLAAVIGVGTIVILLASATIVPLLRDVTYGFIMITEKWYGVGDHVVIEPMSSTGGIVEKLTLRSTKLRTVNGEAMWIHHQHIQGVRVTSAASHPLVVETFVNDPKQGRLLVEEAAKMIPYSPTTVPQPMEITEVKKISNGIWRVTAICEVAPFREWIIDNFAIKVIKKTDAMTGKEPVIVHGPIAYYADATAEKRYRRSATVRQRVRSSARAA